MPKTAAHSDIAGRIEIVMAAPCGAVRSADEQTRAEDCFSADGLCDAVSGGWKASSRQGANPKYTAS
jgi:hypothetical protein